MDADTHEDAGKPDGGQDGGQDAAMPMDPAGTTSPADEFPYAPSNVDPKDPTLDWASPPTVVLSCGLSEFDSDTQSFSGWCGNAQPSVHVVTQTDGPDLTVLLVEDLRVDTGSTLRLTGSRPVVVLASGGIQVAGTVDASSVAGSAGAGAGWSCGPAAGVDAPADSDPSWGSGAGGGGGFGTAGGRGGEGHTYPIPGGGGASRGNPDLVPLLGGCHGGLGGGCTGEAAQGGGAVQLSAAAALEVTGSVLANGADGTAGCPTQGGGAGGGSGGGILLEGASVDVTGLLEASGGIGGDDGVGSISGGSGATSAGSDGSGGDSGSGKVQGGGGGGGGYGRIHS